MGLVLNKLLFSLKFNRESIKIRCAGEALVVVLTSNEICGVGAHGQAFFVVVPHLWNDILSEVSLAMTLMLFPQQAHLFSQDFGKEV